MRSCLLCFIALLSACATTGNREPEKQGPWADVNVFVAPHPDDWQLFMNPAAFHSMDEPDERAVFIHVTAGDGGLGVTGEPTPYFLAREEGALRAIRFMANARSENGLGVAMERTSVERGGHALQRVTYSNATAYFLRLPDGNYEGTGYEHTGWQSLLRLRTGAIPELHAVDASNRYAGWQDLIATIVDIVRSETPPGKTVALHFPELDAKRNPGDHIDHMNTAMAMETVATQFPCASVHRHDEYATGERPINLTGADYLIDVGTWAATSSGLSDNHAGGSWDSLHTPWLGRSYSRVSSPKAECSP